MVSIEFIESVGHRGKAGGLGSRQDTVEIGVDPAKRRFHDHAFPRCSQAGRRCLGLHSEHRKGECGH